MTDKNKAREYVRKLRNEMSAEDNQNLSQIICNRIFDMQEFNDCPDVRSYMSFRNEVNTIPLLEKCLADGKKLSVPRVEGENMDFCHINGMSELVKGYMGIMEPLKPLPVADSHAGIIIVPGMVFDRRGNRAGYGRGFYDRYLAKFPELIKIGVAFDFQLVDEIETNPFDIPMDYVITDKELIRIF